MEKRRHRPKRHRQRGGVTRVAAQKKLRHHHGGQKVDAAAAIAVDDIESNRSIGRVPRRVSSSGSRRLEQGATNRRVAPKRNWRMKRGRNREREREKSVDKEKRDVEGSRGVPLVLARFYWKTSATAALSAHLFFFPATFVEPPTILLPSRLCLRASVSSTSNSSGRTTSSPGFFPLRRPSSPSWNTPKFPRQTLIVLHDDLSFLRCTKMESKREMKHEKNNTPRWSYFRFFLIGRTSADADAWWRRNRALNDRGGGDSSHLSDVSCSSMDRRR